MDPVCRDVWQIRALAVQGDVACTVRELVGKARADLDLDPSFSNPHSARPLLSLLRRLCRSSDDTVRTLSIRVYRAVRVLFALVGRTCPGVVPSERQTRVVVSRVREALCAIGCQIAEADGGAGLVFEAADEAELVTV